MQLDEENEKRKRVNAAFIARGIAMDNSPRGNRTTPGASGTPSSVDNPVFEITRGDKQEFDVPGMIDAQFDLVYGTTRDASDPAATPYKDALFLSIGRAVSRPAISAKAFGAVIGQAYAGAGTPGG